MDPDKRPEEWGHGRLRACATPDSETYETKSATHSQKKNNQTEPLFLPAHAQSQAEKSLIDSLAACVLHTIDDTESAGGNIRVGIGEVRRVG